MRSIGSPWPASSIATVPRSVPAASAASRSSRPSARAASVATIADEKYGPGNTARPISSCTTTASMIPRPSPPSASGTSSPVQPRSTIARHSSGVIPASSCSAMRRTYSFGASAARNARTASRSAIWSAENVKSTNSRYFDLTVMSVPVWTSRGRPKDLAFEGGARGVSRQGDAAVHRAVVRQRRPRRQDPRRAASWA